MSCIIWNSLDNYFIFEYCSVYFRNNGKWNVGYISNFYCVNFSVNFRNNWLGFANMIWINLLYWNICAILNLNWLNRFIFNWNIMGTIDFNNWILKWNLFFCGSEYFFESFWNNTCWNICNWSNSNCINLSRFNWSDWFQ